MPAAPAPGSSPVRSSPVSHSVPPTFVAPSSGFESNLKNNRQQLAIAYQELLDAQQAVPRDAAAVEQARRRWMQLDAAVQKAEEKAPDIFEKTGRSIDRDDLAAELAPMLSAMAESFRSMRHRIKSRLTKAADDAEADAIWQAAVDEVFDELNRSGYSQPFHLQHA